MNNLHLSSCVALCFRFHDKMFFWHVHTQMNPAGCSAQVAAEHLSREFVSLRSYWPTTLGEQGHRVFPRLARVPHQETAVFVLGSDAHKHVSHNNLRSDRDLIKDGDCVHDTCIKRKFSTDILFYSIFCSRQNCSLFLYLKLLSVNSWRQAADLKETLQLFLFSFRKYVITVANTSWFPYAKQFRFFRLCMFLLLVVNVVDLAIRLQAVSVSATYLWQPQCCNPMTLDIQQDKKSP